MTNDQLECLISTIVQTAKILVGDGWDKEDELDRLLQRMQDHIDDTESEEAKECEKE